MIPVLTAEQRELRNVVRALLDTPEAVRIRERHACAAPGEEIDVRPVHRLLGERGLLAVSWPHEYGGGGRTAVEAAIVHEEIVRSGLPDLSYVVSICYVGDFLLTAAGEALRAAYLPLLASGEINACTLYSEPGAGSDLGALAGRAEPVGGGYRLHATKVHAQATRYADHALVAARIGERGEAKHDGITLFWVPLHAPGVRVEQVMGLDDHPYSRVELDGVEVPADHVIGPPGQGWPLLNAALTVERTGFEAHLKTRSWLEAVARRARRTGLAEDPLVADRLAALEVEVTAGGVLAWEMVGKQARREVDHVGSAMSKWYNTELGTPIARLALEVEGPAGVLNGRYPGEPGPGRAEQFLRQSPGLTLSAGTSEIMLYAISTGHLRVHAEQGGPSALDDPHAGFRRRLAGFLAGGGSGWAALSGANVVRLTLPPPAGGLGGRLGESLTAAEEMGKVLLRHPWAGTVALAEAVAADGPDSPWWPLVCAVADGKCSVAVTADLTGQRDALELTPADGGFVLTGTAECVPLADDADLLLVVATTASGPRFALVDRTAPGVSVDPRPDVSDGRLCRVVFDAAPVAAGEVLWSPGEPGGRDLLTRLWLRQAGHLLGVAQRALDLALAHTRRRRQFDAAIATFQHVSFRMAALATRLHAARRLLHRLADDHDHTRPDHRRAACALALVAELAADTTTDALHLHGASGLTGSAEVQRHYRTAAVEGLLFGSPRALRSVASPSGTTPARRPCES
ncbi:Acyl-CoA dehydrogenase [Lentzea fradiae]|uniref:Acyl-CoA dehydrogenase n=1 Tax=Lentzea fradiae TaxID=200378 RepID=A0A1G8BE69_9PSEU|nr:acyl-CoA dehydrogenase family protein [Lentzea fradiae]SDH31374.1 Acyl-CoA dehydrogenase [Lentzea fradiae]